MSDLFIYSCLAGFMQTAVFLIIFYIFYNRKKIKSHIDKILQKIKNNIQKLKPKKKTVVFLHEKDGIYKQKEYNKQSVQIIEVTKEEVIILIILFIWIIVLLIGSFLFLKNILMD